MVQNGQVQGRRWIFADCEYFERGRQLRVRGAPLRMEGKPLDVLQVLLERPAEVMTKDQLLGEVWEVASSDQSLATAVAKLRKAFGGPRDRILLNVTGVGYRMAVPVVCIEDRTAGPPSLSLTPGDPMPFREQWRAVRPLDTRTPHMVWVAEQRRTGEQRVFKFATDGIRLRALQREVTLSRLFAASFPVNRHFVRIYEWNFNEAPFFTEAPFAGGNLADLVRSPELAALDANARASLVAQIARAVAEAHSIGVLHNDLKPSNILVVERDSAAVRWQVRVADFGIAMVSDFQRLQDLELTDHGEFMEEPATPERGVSRGTAMYLAPELRRPDAQPDTRADVFALGVILYQVLCGDMQAPLAVGWEEHVPDPLLREDIEGACQANPERRFQSAAELAQRLEELPERRTERQRQEEDGRERYRLEQAVLRARVRQPWVVATVLVLLIGTCGTAWFFVRATQERNKAVRRGETLAALNHFLTVDLLSQVNPNAGKHRTPAQQVTLVQAIDQARSVVDRRFAHAPEIAARLHMTLAAAYGSLNSLGDSEREYRAAADRFEQAQGSLSEDALQARLRGIIVLMMEQTPQAHEASEAQIRALQPHLQAIRHPGAELQGWEAMADSSQILTSDQPALPAVSMLEQAIDRAQRTPGFDPALLSAMKLRLSGVYLKANRGQDALNAAEASIAEITRQDGPDSPKLSQAELFREEALFLLRRYPEVITVSRADYARFIGVYGPLGRETLSAQDLHAQAEGAVGQFAQSASDWMDLYHATSGNPAMQYFSETSIVQAGLMHCHAGNYLRGTQLLQQALEEITAQGGAKALNYSEGSLDLAQCILAQQQDSVETSSPATLAHVRQLMTQVDLKVLASFPGTEGAQAELMFTRAMLAFREGNCSRARQLVAPAKPLLDQPGADPWEINQLLRLQKSIASTCS